MAEKYDLPKLRYLAEHNARNWWRKGVKIFGAEIGEMPEVKMNSRLTSTAGRAFIHSDPQYIDLSCYLMVRYMDEFFEDTIPHELAHIIAFRMFECSGHGPEWKRVATELYGNCSRQHTMITKSLANKGFTKIERDSNGKTVFYKGDKPYV